MSKGLDVLNNLGVDKAKAVLENKAGSPLEDMLIALTGDVIDRITQKADEYGINASNNLKQSIQPTKVVYSNGNLSIGIQADFYWKYIDQGVNGTQKSWGAPSWGKAPSTGQSFHASILSWVQNKGVTLPQQFSSYDSFAWAIIKNKIKNGQEPKPFISDVINEQLISFMREPIELLFGKSITIEITSHGSNNS